MKEKVRKLREKARGTYRFASSYAEEQSKNLTVKTKSGKKLDLNSALDDLDEFAKTSKERSADNQDKRNNRFANMASKKGKKDESLDESKD